MMFEELLSTCPICGRSDPSEGREEYRCEYCRFILAPKKVLGVRFKGRFVVRDLGDDYSLVKSFLLGQTFSLAEIRNFAESVYSDRHLAEFAVGNYDHLTMPASTLTQILLEQLRETCFIQIDDLKRAHGPVLEAVADRFPETRVPVSGLEWQDAGNLFLTDARLVFPSNRFTFIRLDRKLVALKAYENGLAVQRKGEGFATYFVGCKGYQAALGAAYILGKAPPLQRLVQLGVNNLTG